MPVKKYGSILDTIIQKSVFGVEDLINQGVPRPYAKKRLHELSKDERIFRVERGKYTVLDDVYVVATHLTRPCYLSMWSALNLHGLTTQVPFSAEIVTTRKRFNRKITFKGTDIIFYTPKPRMMFGYENLVWKENFRIPVAKPEKIIIDALYFGTIPFEELKQVVDDVDSKVLSIYAKLTKNDRIVNRVKELMEC